jgi:hypothetical protein
MQFVTGYERHQFRKGLRYAVELGLELRFGDEGLELIPAFMEVYDIDDIKAVINALRTGVSLEEVRRLCSPPPGLASGATAEADDTHDRVAPPLRPDV